MPARRHIGVNALYLLPGEVGGTEIYLRNLLHALAAIDSRNQYFVFTNRETGSALTPGAPNFQTIQNRLPARSRPLRLFWEQTGLALQTFRKKLDVLLNPGFTSPVLSRGGRVTVIHDLQHKHQPENFGLLELQAWNLAVWGATRRSDRIITVSEPSRQDILGTYSLPPSRVVVIAHGVEPGFFSLQENEALDRSRIRGLGVPDEPYLLAVSTVHPHKNWLNLLEAYRSLVDAGRPERLVASGVVGKAWKQVHRRVKELGLAERVHFLGWQPRETLLCLFKFTSALVFPSTFEGFGMPVLEALAARVPVVCSDIPVLRELADGAALFFDPASSADLAGQIRVALENEPRRQRLLARGRERALQFSWQRAAEQTLAILLDAARDR
jgi:glycosyltransferase involved in cell wall biosynthesis